MSRARPPEDFEIASLKKKQSAHFDPMAPGTGTPWEDRATHGTVGAFIKTCIKSLTAPGQLTNSIRRPETTGDARGFLIGICAIWGISMAIHMGYFVWQESKIEGAEFDLIHTIVLAALGIGGASVGGFFLFKIYNTVYGKLISQEKDASRITEVLLYNVNAYALGPSLFALIPFVGPGIALLWIFIDLIAVGNKRLRLPMPAAVIDALISLLVVLGIVGAVYGIGEMLILHRVMDFYMFDMPDKSSPMPGPR